EGEDTLLDRVETPAQRVVDGDAESNLAGVVGIPVLETPCVWANLETVAFGPFGGVHIEEGRLQSVEEATPHVEQPSSARAAEILAPGRREHVAADLLHVNWHLPHRLACVE